MSLTQRAVFPLSTVLFPGAILQLVIFEPRYIDMVSYCLKHQLPFIISKIIEGKDHGIPATFESVATLAYIVDFGTSHDGLLSIKVRGGERIEVNDVDVTSNKLLISDRFELLKPVDDIDLPEELNPLQSLLGKLSRLPETDIELERVNMGSAEYIVHQLAQILPLENDFKQYLLEEDDALEKCISLYEQLLSEAED